MTIFCIQTETNWIHLSAHAIQITHFQMVCSHIFYSNPTQIDGLDSAREFGRGYVQSLLLLSVWKLK